MRFTLFIVAVCLITLHATTVTGQHGYVYTVAEYAGPFNTGYMKVGHSSDAPGNDRYLNIKQRFRNIQAGNPRRLVKQLVCQCNNKQQASIVEGHIRLRAIQTRRGFANQVGGSREWLYVPHMGNFVQFMSQTAQGAGCTCPYNLPFEKN